MPPESIFRNERAILQMLSNVEARVLNLERQVAKQDQDIRELKSKGGGSLEGVNVKLDLLLLRSELTLQQGVSIMATAQQLESILNEIDQTTNDMAATLTAQGPVLNEIDSDIDALLTRGTEPIPQPLLERFELHRTRLGGLSTTLTETAARLTATAAKSPAADSGGGDTGGGDGGSPVVNPPIEEPPAPVN